MNNFKGTGSCTAYPLNKLERSENLHDVMVYQIMKTDTISFHYGMVARQDLVQKIFIAPTVRFPK